MKRAVAVLLATLLAAPGCSVRLGTAKAVHAASPFGVQAGSPTRAAGITKEYAEKLPVGARVRVAVTSGQSFSATYMGVEGDGIRVQKRTRIPEPPFVVPLTDLTVLALETGASGADQFWKSLLVGVGAGAGVFVTLVLIALAAD